MNSNANKVAATQAMLVVAVIVLVVGILILSALALTGWINASIPLLIGVGLLQTILITPLIYIFVFRSLQNVFEKRRDDERLAEDMSRMAITDPVTHLMNRRGITVGLLDAMAQAERYGAPLTIAMVDIDHFRRLNDAHGQEVGDKVLSEIASILTDSLRMPDKVGRYGGEEFLVALPHTTLVLGRKIAERMRVAVAKWSFEINGKEQNLSISVGIAQFHKGEDLELLLSRVEEALLDAKSSGRNRVAAAKSS